MNNYPRPVWWVVLSPEYDVNGDDYYEPPETIRDVLFVFCKSKHRAKVLATRAMRRFWRRGCWTKSFKNKYGRTIYPRRSYIAYYDPDSNPMAVLTVERVKIDMKDLAYLNE